MTYGESNQAWNTIKLKSEFLNEFKQLKEKRSKFSYEIICGSQVLKHNSSDPLERGEFLARI